MRPLDVVQAFIRAINAHDTVGLAGLMTEDHRFTDSLGQVITGREAMRASWTSYFSMVPDYHLTAERWLCDGPVVVMLGTAGGTYSPDGSRNPALKWATPAAVRALVRDDRVAEWQVYADNEPIREVMRRNAKQSAVVERDN